MRKKAWVYICSIFAVTIFLVAIVLFETELDELSHHWWTFIFLTTAATLAQLFKAESPDHQLFHTTLVFLFAGLVLLPPIMFILLVAIPHIIEWAKERLTNSEHLRSWYLQPFNISTHIISGLFAHFLILNTHLHVVSISSQTALYSILAAVVYVALNHFLIGVALDVARGLSFRESGILEIDSLLTDLTMLLIGISVAVLWQINNLLIFPALMPLILIYRALLVPKLIRQTETDPKTGLYNASFFNESIEQELKRSERFNRPLTLIMCDLDFLRKINNTYGHLAGDAVLIHVAQILKNGVRGFDLVSRFGGEEFAILLPETTIEEAYPRIEDIRKAIEEAEIYSSTNSIPIKATMSFGIAEKNEISLTAKELIHRADLALYQAKECGRNLVKIYDSDLDPKKYSILENY